MKSTLNFALLQMDVQAGNPQENYLKVQSMLQKAVSADPIPDVIVLPEMWNTGYALQSIHDTADQDGNETMLMLADFARKHRIYIHGGSVAVKKNGRIYNTSFGFDPEGLQIMEYSKIHLFGLMDEPKYLDAGDKLGIFPFNGIQAGTIICYDLRFPELTRSLAALGAQILFVPAEWPNPRLHHWRTLLQARAIENQMYVVAVNRMGQSDNTVFFGHSMVIDPWGEIIAEADEQEQVLTASISLDKVQEARSRIPVWQDRKPELYPNQ
ncbi:MAG: nitrilase [Paenibacillus sp. RIFOXYA1_FULL_44_5]|nr:MAG: nitrilase [Paenibacillus sp. RIFOXYA1_FULL_44_5]